MDSFLIQIGTQARKLPTISNHQHNRTRYNSTGSSTTTNVDFGSSCASSIASTTFTSYTKDIFQRTPPLCKISESDMTTYYHYDENNNLIGSSTSDPITPYAYVHPETSSYEPEGDVVGAYLAHRAMFYPAPAAPEAYQFQAPAYQAYGQPYDDSVAPEAVDPDYWSGEDYDSRGHAGSPYPDYASTVGYVGFASYSGEDRPYPNPEDIRHRYTLHGLLPYIQPERKLNSLDGPLMKIVEQDTGAIFANKIPKKLLVLFLGRGIVNRFIRTVEREDPVNWKGLPTCQQLDLPRGRASQSSVHILVSWMERACQYRTMGDMGPVRVPKNTFAACSLAQTMELFGLHKDAYRVDIYISQNHFVRPIFSSELESLWNCLGENNRYVYAAIKVVGKRLRAYESGVEDALSEADDMLALLQKHLRLNTRVRDEEVNEKYQPVFGTEWMRNLGRSTQPNQADRHVVSEQQSSNVRSSDIRNGLGRSRYMGNSTPPDAVTNGTKPLKTTTKVGKVGVLRIVAENKKPPPAETEVVPEEGDKVVQW